MSPRPEQCALTPHQEKLWEITRASLSWNCPAFTHLFYTMLDNSGSKHIAYFTKEVPTAATDGGNLLLNPDTFFTYDLNERVFICSHEIMHCVLAHCELMHRLRGQGKISYPDGTKLDYDQEDMNRAMDYVINDVLVESKVGSLNKDWLHDKTLGTASDGVIDVYKKVHKNKKPQTGKGFDQHLAPGTSQGKDPTSAANGRSAAKWGTAVAAAAAAARAVGKLPRALERLFSDVLDPQVDWREKIQSLFARKVGSGAYDWRKPDRRLISRTQDPIIAPGRSGFGAGTVIVAVDTSGSIGPKELDMFFAEMSGIIADVRPKELVVMWADATVQRVDYCDDAGDLNDLRHKGAPGGGGTSFIPVFEEVSKLGMQPDAVVYLTDGMGSFPAAPPQYPVIWGNIHPGSKYPFGDVVDVPKQA